jgi:hypothetical protein
VDHLCSKKHGNISGAHGTLVYMVHILNLIHQSQIQRYSHILGKTPPSPWLEIFANNPLSPNLSNSVGSEIDESDLICAPCALDMFLRNTWDNNIDGSYRNKILIDTKVIWVMIEISTLFCQPHRSNSFMVLQIINNKHCQHFYKQQCCPISREILCHIPQL